MAERGRLDARMEQVREAISSLGEELGRLETRRETVDALLADDARATYELSA